MQKSVEVLGNTTYLTMDALLDGNEQAGYLLLHIDEKELNYTFVNL